MPAIITSSEGNIKTFFDDIDKAKLQPFMEEYRDHLKDNGKVPGALSKSERLQDIGRRAAECLVSTLDEQQRKQFPDLAQVRIRIQVSTLSIT